MVARTTDGGTGPSGLPSNGMGVRFALARMIGEKADPARFATLLPQVDASLRRLSRGRVDFALLGRVPGLVLLVHGRLTGRLREVALQARAVDGGWVVCGSNWGLPDDPAWALNLRVDPRPAVQIRGRRRPVTARELHGEERDRMWTRLIAVWPAFDGYRERSGRTIPLFLLTPTDGPGPATAL